MPSHSPCLIRAAWHPGLLCQGWNSWALPPQAPKKIHASQNLWKPSCSAYSKTHACLDSCLEITLILVTHMTKYFESSAVLRHCCVKRPWQPHTSQHAVHLKQANSAHSCNRFKVPLNPVWTSTEAIEQNPLWTCEIGSNYWPLPCSSCRGIHKLVLKWPF